MSPLSAAHLVAALSVFETGGHGPPSAGFLPQAFLGPHRALAKDLLLWKGSLFSYHQPSLLLSWDGREMGDVFHPVQVKVGSALLPNPDPFPRLEFCLRRRKAAVTPGRPASAPPGVEPNSAASAPGEGENTLQLPGFCGQIGRASCRERV